MTGATGFIGLNIVTALRAANHEVRAYVRPTANRRYLDRFEVDYRVGELADLETLIATLRGADAVIHTAGNTSCDFRQWQALQAANVQSTANLITAAVRVGVRRIIYTSTTSTIGACNNPAVQSVESTPLIGFRARSPYARTKLQAETLLLQSRQQGLEPIILNPAEVIGPFDHNLQWGRIVIATALRCLPFIPPGSGSFCAAADVAQAHVSALTRGDVGGRHILAGHDLSFAALIEAIADRAQVPAEPLSRAPYGWLRFRALAQERLGRWWPGEPPVDAYRMRVFAGHYRFSSRKAEAELGYSSRPPAQMIDECYSWYRDYGFL